MVPKMLLHVENVLNYPEDPDYRNELSKVIGKYISANIDAVCEEVTQLMVVNTDISLLGKSTLANILPKNMS